MYIHTCLLVHTNFGPYQEFYVLTSAVTSLKLKYTNAKMRRRLTGSYGQTERDGQVMNRRANLFLEMKPVDFSHAQFRTTPYIP